MLSEATLRKEGVLVRDMFDEGEGGGGCGWSPFFWIFELKLIYSEKAAKIWKKKS